MKSKPQIKAIFFDYGGVFTKDGSMNALFDHCQKKYGKNVEGIKDDLGKIWNEAEIGKIPAHLYRDLLGKHFGVSGQQIMDEGLDVYGFEKDVYDFAKSLKGKYKLGMITNQINDWFETIAKARNLYALFDDNIVTSYDSGLAKPDLAIYAFAAKKIGMIPEDCIFIDDREKNVLGARAAGMKAILFQNLAQLKNDLKKLGVK